ncbi:hypothetical protein [Colwellia sp. C1TZA3]|uniref:hypothetical protein n=1 Tax=Colwellia sp. C1TZA3 TaxID=2508879 RepID=UPI0011B956DF|nr:hypothetical protein [Colwellia sp. C1TZA3]TWX73499.1 hypothetical protein ESZ39_03465 [Colwellia sp. C1TZA3]
MTVKKLAQRLFFIKPLLNFAFVAGLVFIAILLLNGSIAEQNSYGIPSLLLATWSLLLSAILGLLVNTPNTDDIPKGWFAQMKNRLAKSVFTLAAIVFILISLALLYATIKLLTL